MSNLCLELHFQPFQIVVPRRCSRAPAGSEEDVVALCKGPEGLACGEPRAGDAHRLQHTAGPQLLQHVRRRQAARPRLWIGLYAPVVSLLLFNYCWTLFLHQLDLYICKRSISHICSNINMQRSLYIYWRAVPDVVGLALVERAHEALQLLAELGAHAVQLERTVAATLGHGDAGGCRRLIIFPKKLPVAASGLSEYSQRPLVWD